MSRWIRLAGVTAAIVGVTGAFVAAPAGHGVRAHVASTGGLAARHLRLVRSDPAANDTLKAAPTTLRLWFSQPPEMAVTTIGLSLAGGGIMALARPSRGAEADAPVVASLRVPAPSGTYTVTWRTTARDGHPAKGAFQFVIAAAQK